MVNVRTRRSVAVGTCLLLAGACNCAEEPVRGLTTKEDLGVEVRGGVSCKGEPILLRAFAFGGKAPYTFEWSPADGLSDAHDAAPFAPGGTTRTYTVTVTDAQGLEATGTAKAGPRAAPKVQLA